MKRPEQLKAKSAQRGEIAKCGLESSRKGSKRWRMKASEHAEELASKWANACHKRMENGYHAEDCRDICGVDLKAIFWAGWRARERLMRGF